MILTHAVTTSNEPPEKPSEGTTVGLCPLSRTPLWEHAWICPLANRRSRDRCGGLDRDGPLRPLRESAGPACEWLCLRRTTLRPTRGRHPARPNRGNAIAQNGGGLHPATRLERGSSRCVRAHERDSHCSTPAACSRSAWEWGCDRDEKTKRLAEVEFHDVAVVEYVVTGDRLPGIHPLPPNTGVLQLLGQFAMDQLGQIHHR